MSKLSTGVFSFLCLISVCLGQDVIQNGQCDETVAGIPDFDVLRFLGTWYEVERYPQATQTGQCNRAVYGLGADGVITVQNSQVTAESLSIISGQASEVAGQSGVLQVTLNTNIASVTQTLYVLATDYDNYALLYSCSNIDGNTRRRVGSWKLSKQLGPLSDTANAAINDIIENTQGLSQSYYLPTSQTDAACFYYPEWDTLPETIELPGPCDTTITGVAAFNAQMFLGTWYEVARYPQPTQTGQCNRAVYGPLTGGVITVQNSQVNNEALYTIRGTATVVAGQPGELLVTFPTNSGSVTQRVIVLTTDNVYYALLYSCENILTPGAETRRRVGSWKLSKQLGPLSGIANAAINNVIENTQGLRQSYYQDTSQTYAACFYYPEWDTLPATIELPGPCDTTITGVAAFNAERFLGTWYEVARYPQPTQTGQCNRAVYGPLTGGVITVQNSQVNNEALSTITGTATVVAGQPGVLQVTLPTNSGPVTRWVIILTTDNENYALLYSCENILTPWAETRRRVGSWKLSKQLGPLSDTANAAINDVIENTQGLSQSYYLPTSQTDTACFYYPEWDTLPATIELPGPCDTTITGVAAFNAERFLGTWYEVARYPQPTQTGQCNRAVYGPLTGGVITVQNSQVNNEALYTIRGTASAVAGQFGVLQVTLNTNSGPVTQTLYVLDTDYENYALLYSCSNIDGNTRRRVGSWKLSKQVGPLSDTANAAINNVIENTQGLRQSYYQDTSQTYAACFYYPEWDTLPATIELPGPCDTTITGVAAFNAERFLGTWYEVARYPQPTQTGQCNRAVYGPLTGGVITVQNSQVNNEALYTIQGTASAVAGQPGVLQVTLPTNSGPVTRWVIILTTDNENYALLYSCENILTPGAETRRRVGSWKLSKQLGPLSDTANAAINDVIENTQGLSQSYYLPTSQTDTACFYYPEWDTLPATIELPGPCDTTITGVAAFNAERFLGTWYEVARYPQPTQTGQCNRAVYGPLTGGVITVQNSQVNNEALYTIRGTASAVAGQFGVLQVTLNTIIGPVTQTLYVLDTDYENYALLYSCSNIDDNSRRRVGSWKLSKQLGPLSDTANAAINNVIENTQGLSQSYYLPTSQTDAACFYYPEWDTLPTTIELPGPCDTTITGVAAFNAERFLGTWYEVARYPQPTQTGQCNRAVYGPLTGGVITVQNSQVNNEALYTLRGTASAVAGQFGVLQVTLNTNSGPVTQTLYVLDTDYENYALLYSCSNIDGNTRRRVGSWKLSKQLGPLSDTANTAINDVIENTQGLSQSYYLPTSQTDAACFYYPEWDTLPTTIELPGPCDTTITGVAAFNAERFLGTWYEVARYPQPTQTGQCNRAVYWPLTAGVITVKNSQVNNEALYTIQGTASAVAGQVGVLQVTLNTDSGPVTQTLYVLDTDYENYALLYSCSNIDGNTRRRVGSWKLSKQLGPLSDIANAAINDVIENTQGLSQSYYLPTSQTDAACFYYPEWDTLPTTIELPGPCDTTITGVAEFNVERFLGTWYEVAKYPQPTQTGQCNRAVYGPLAGGVITVQNSQVNNEALYTIRGIASAVAGQSGVLQIILNTNSGPVTQTLYVLDTDYDNYALLYSCNNIDENTRRRVGSWKLSKHLGPLSDTATAAINNVIEDTQGLSQSYYQPASLTHAACFHYPTTQTGDKVIIPGQCDIYISGQENIDMARFANGTWYHIQSYDQVGDKSCIGTRLSLEEGAISVNSIEVIGGAVNITEGLARIISAENGQFSLVWCGLEDTTTVTVMATDYDGYAIAYTCENTDSVNRQVGVWLLSRGRTWPAAGETALETLVEDRDEFTLREGYFKDIPQNDDCPEPSSAFLFKSSIIVIFICTVLQFV